MKKLNVITIIKCVFVFAVLFSISFIANGQKDKVRIRLNYYSEDGGSYLTVKSTTRKGKKYEAVEGVIIELFLTQEREGNDLGSITTDENGEGKFTLPPKFYMAVDSLYRYNFIARLHNDPNYQDQSQTLEIYKGQLNMDLVGSDSVNQIVAKVLHITDSGAMPVAQTEVKFYVQRLFSLLPFGGDYNITDDDGVVSLIFPKDMPGDQQGDVRIVCKVLDHELLGDISVSETVNWGESIPQKLARKRTLWTARNNPPWSLIIFPNLALAVVWGYIIYLIFILFRIRTLGKKNN